MSEPNLTNQIIERLKVQFDMTEQDKYLRGRCPECNKKTLWTWLASPGNVQCDRLNHCGYSEKTKSLFPDLFERLNETYQPTPTNPTATADAYLSLVRGFDISQIKDWYRQGKYWHPRGNKGTATVRFHLNSEVYWERLIDDIVITDEDGSKELRNKNFKGSFKGLWWQPPGLTINKGESIWLVEGILDAIALNLNGIKAVAILSSATFPSESIKPYLKQDITWVIATDNDKAGRAALAKHHKKFEAWGEHVTAALSSDNDIKTDWNDLHQQHKLTASDIDYYCFLGKQAIARSYRQKAQIIWQYQHNQHYFVFTFYNKTYSAKVDKTSYDKFLANVFGVDGKALSNEQFRELVEQASQQERTKVMEQAFSQAVTLKEIATFSMDYLYFQKPDNGEDGQYFFSFTPAHHGQNRQIAFTHKTISAASDFKRSAMRIPGALFTGLTADLDWLYREWIRRNSKEVRTLDFVGYDKTSGAYIFNQFAVQNGKVHHINEQAFFELKDEGIKTTVDIKQTLSDNTPKPWLADFKTAFGIKGLVVLAWWFGTFFVEQIRAQHRSYPFFALIGEAASGKSSLVGFLWKLTGKEEDVFNPNTSTLSGRTRTLAQVANMPVVFNETDNEDNDRYPHQKRFDWNDQKDLYEGVLGRATAIKTHDNTTRKPVFRAALMAVQNVPVIAGVPILTRFCHLDFDTSHHSPAGYEAAVRLNSMAISDVNGFLINAVKNEKAILKQFNQQLQNHQTRLLANKAITTTRVGINHAKLMAMADCLQSLDSEITKQDLANIHQEIETMACQRQAVLSDDTPIIQQFWAQFDYLDSKPPTLSMEVDFTNQMNHSTHPDRQIAVNLEHYHSACKVSNLPLIDPKDLRRQLPSSKQHKYIGNKPVKSRLENRTVRCWLFKR